MTMPALASSRRMVGRQTELDTLMAAYAQGCDGTPRTVLVRGEAGVGKTRLVREFLAGAERSTRPGLPSVVAVGQCVDLGPIGAPFGPIRRVLRDLHTAVGTKTLREAAGSPSALAALAAVVPGIVDEAAPADESVSGFAEAIEVVLERLSLDRHLVVVLEDLQWADAATMGLLKTLASTLRGRHLTIAATYRSDDIDRFHPLRPVLAELERTRAIVRVDVEPLTADEVAEQVALLVTADFSDDQLGTLVDRSGGIPFLVEELVDLGSGPLPDTLRELVLARYTRLSDATQVVVRTMAAGGVHTDHDVLTAVAPVDDHELDIALREAIDARVILTEGAGYTFRHALTQEAVHGEMLPSERVRAHRRYAEYLSEYGGDSPDAVSAVAEHWLVARELALAFDATVRALEQSRATFAPSTSVRLVERLTELWDQVPDAATRSATCLAELHLAAAQAWHELGDPHRALRATTEGLAQSTDDSLVRAALLRQRFVQQYNTDNTGDWESLEEAAALLQKLDGDPAKVLLSRVMTNLALGNPNRETAAHLARAIDLAEQAGDHAALAIALTNESWRISDEDGDEPRAVASLARALTLRPDPAVRAYVGAAYVDLLSRLGRFDEAALVGEGHYAEAARAGIDRGSGAEIAAAVAHSLFSAGRPAEAVRYGQRARRLVDRPSRVGVIRMLATHYAWNDDVEARDALLAAERPALEEARRAHPKKHSWWEIESVDAVLASTTGLRTRIDHDRLRQRIASIQHVLESDISPPARRYTAVSGAIVVKALGAGDDPDVRSLRDRIRAAVTEWPDRGTAPALAAFIGATLADAADEPLPDRIMQWRAVENVIAGGVMPVRHRHIARLSLAAVLIESGGREEASGILDRIAAEAPPHGVARVGRWAQELSSRAGLAPAHSGVSIAGLTPREGQVLALIADGLTNAQIGGRLFISPKTASVHVSAILAKVGASNRAEAAALFVSSGDVH